VVGNVGIDDLINITDTTRVLSGWQKFSRQKAPWNDARPFVDALVDAFTLDTPRRWLGF
jgi:hypothetical protein